MELTHDWGELVAAATLGTDRRAGATAAELLSAAGASAAYRWAGIRPTPIPEPPAPAPDETAPTVAAAPAARLWRMLGSGHSGLDGRIAGDLLAEWLRLAAAAGRRVPPELLPELLAAGRRHTDLRPLIVAAGGARAGWLAAQQPGWSYLSEVGDVLATPDPASWPDGTLGQRIGNLTVVRRDDPAGGLALLREAWPQLPSEERAPLLAALGPQLCATDEPFLADALADRRKEVRQVAAELLARLPGSQYTQRMVQRARACLRLAGRTVQLTPPAECDRAMRRDGITPKPPSGTGERAWWLEEILARTPLATWEPELATARVPDGWDEPVRRGLVRAAAAQADPQWAARLLDRYPAKPNAAQRQQIESLYPALTPAELQARAERGLRKDATGTVGLDRMLKLLPAPWPERFGRTLLAALVALAETPRHAYQLESLCLTAAVRLPPSLAGELPADPPGPALAKLADVLHFRHEMIEEFA